MKSKVISFVKDPHIAFCGYDDPRTLFCQYRLLCEVEGAILLVSVCQDELDGSLELDDIVRLHRKECFHAPIKTIIASIDGWVSNGDSKEYAIETVLDGFLKVELIGSYQYHEVRKYYGIET